MNKRDVYQIFVKKSNKNFSNKMNNKKLKVILCKLS